MSAKGKPPSTLTERQQKWMASVKASLERDTGKTLEQCVKTGLGEGMTFLGPRASRPHLCFHWRAG